MGLLLCNVGLAESYVCKDNKTATNKVGTYIWERISKDRFSLREVNKDLKIPFDIYYEDKNFIVLIVCANLVVGTIALNKKDLTCGDSQIYHPFDNFNIDDYTSGKCDKIN